MSDSSLNEIQTKLIKLDNKSDEQLKVTTTSGASTSQATTLPSSALNILTSIKKPNQNSIFIVPHQPTTSSSNLTTVTLLNDNISPPTKQQQQTLSQPISNTPLSNKITVIPLNFTTNQKSTTNPSTQTTTTTPVKILNDLNSPTQPKTAIFSSISNAKKLIQINSTNTTGPSIQQASSLSSPIKSNNLISNLDRSPQSTSTNTKIFTITTTTPSHTNQNANGLSTPIINNNNNSNLNIITTSSNNTATLTSTGNTILNSNTGNKIQYVKIVNTPQTTTTGSQQLNSNQSTNIPNTTTAIKITSIGANNNSSVGNIQDATNTRLSSILSNMAPTTIKTIQKPITNTTTPTVVHNSTNILKQNIANFDTQQNSMLYEAINSSNDQSQNLNKTTTIQLVNTNANSNNTSNQSQILSQQQRITPTIKTPVIQRIQSFQNNNQSITKTIVSAATPTNTNLDRTNNYKVLTQQLPHNNLNNSNTNQIIQATNTSSAQQLTTVKTSTNTTNQIGKTLITNTNSTITNPIAITKTTNNSNEDNRKQVIITSVKNDTSSSNKSNVSTAGTTTTNSTASSLQLPITLTPIASSNFNQLNNNNTIHMRTSNLNQTNFIDNDKLNMQTSKPSTSNNNNLRVSSSTISNNLTVSSNANNSFSGIMPIQQTSPASSVSNSLNINNLQPQPPAISSTSTSSNSTSVSSSSRKPCNCTKSMCLKLYCDCFAIGSFCHDCNCINCFNTLEHEDERNKAIKMVLDRNPQAFQSKIGKFTASIALSKVIPQQTTATSNGIEDLITASSASEELDEIQSRHVKGCNCKKSNCLKRYCECYLAKIQCSALCKCVGCKNCDESTRTLLQLANAADIRKQQQQQQQQSQQQLLQQQQQSQQNSQRNLLLNSAYLTQSNINSQNFLNSSSSFRWRNSDLNNFEYLTKQEQLQLEQQQNLNRSYASVTNEAVQVTCLRLIDKVTEELERLNTEKIETNKTEVSMEEGELKKDDNSEYDELMEKILIEEFGKCLAEIIENSEKRTIFSN